MDAKRKDRLRLMDAKRKGFSHPSSSSEKKPMKSFMSFSSSHVLKHTDMDRSSVNRKGFSRRSSSSSSQKKPIPQQEFLLPSRKLCIVYCCTSPEMDYYNIFIVDLKKESGSAADEFIRRDATLRLRMETFDGAFCVVGSKLYMFEGSDRLYNPCGKCRKSVFTYDLSSSNDQFNVILETFMLDPAPDMLFPKNFPVAILTPAGKVVVFSAFIEFNPYKIAGAEFELYDPADGSWSVLPGICDGRSKDEGCVRFWTVAYSWIGKSVLFLQTEIGMFTLDLESPDGEGWVQLDCWAGACSIPFNGGPFLMIGNDLCLTPLCAYDVTKENGFCRPFKLPHSFFGEHPVSLISPSITFLDDGIGGGHGQCCNFCVVQTGIDDATEHPQFIIDVLCCDPVKYREDKKKMGDSARLDTAIVKSFRFCLDARSYSIYPLTLFSF